MKLTTKFDKGDEVFVLFNGKIEKAKVEQINTYDSKISYDLIFKSDVMNDRMYEESRLASTKQELIERL